ncbi:hypothetical protein L6164_013880 [Bauhinia variegata]|uniref:Uncharacterized protein n=1 Tax=Bauhinia variegata TaxID=167791 RepID=A0ACB9NG37_BAUVA|nr:hypothetical protein L6164_013880 [Bauhinia variegata]
MMAAPVVSNEEFNLFHNIDRELYKVLAVTLSREPNQSMQIVALCLWLEKRGYRYVVKKIISLPLTLINEVADELVACLSVIFNPFLGTTASSEGNDIPLLQILLDKPISLRHLFDNHVAAAQGVNAMGEYVCVRALGDIVRIAMMKNATDESSRSQIIFGSFESARENEVPVEGRTVFVTFSKGYPVSEKELREFIAKLCGQADCIETLYMQEVQPQEQSLFARVIFHQASMIDKILRGERKVKFSINGKHVWARKFVPKRRDLPPPPPPLPPVQPPMIYQYPGESLRGMQGSRQV